MSNLKAFLVVVLSLFALSACEKPTPGGKIPKEFVKDAMKYLGVYQGEVFGGGKGRIVLSISKDNVVSARFSGGDLLGDSSCRTQLGNLKSVQVSGNALAAAKFDLRSQCVEGKELVINFKNDRAFSINVESSREDYEVCPTSWEVHDCYARHGINCEACVKKSSSQKLSGYFRK